MSYCEDIREEWTDLVAGEVSDERRRELEAHVHQCGPCARLLGEHRRVWGLLGEWRVSAPSNPGFAPVEKPRYVRFALGLSAAAAVLLLVFAVLPASAHRRRAEEMMSFIRPAAPTVATLAGTRPLAPQDEIATAADEIADIRLPDGSTLLLSSDTRLQTAQDENGLRFVGTLVSGRAEVHAEPGAPMRIGIPGGYVETVGTRFVIEAADSPAIHVKRIARTRVLQGKVIVFDGAEEHVLESGQSKLQAEFEESGELFGTVSQAGTRRLVEGEFPAVRFDARGAGETWLHARERRELPGPGQSVRIRFAERGGALWVTSWDPWEQRIHDTDCSEDVQAALDFPGPEHIAAYRVLSLSEKPEKALEAATRLAFVEDPFAAPRIDRARRRLGEEHPWAALQLGGLLAEVPPAPGVPPAARSALGIPMWGPVRGWTH